MYFARIMLAALLCSLFPPLRVMADGQAFYVTSRQVLPVRAEPYLFSKLVIDSGASLTIDPGVQLSLTSSADVVVAGELHAVGSQVKPISLQAADRDAAWGNVEMAPAGILEFRYVVLSDFTGPHALQSQAQLSHVVLRDGLYNATQVVGLSTAQAFSSQFVRFENQRMGSRMLQSGMWFEGQFASITVNDPSFHDTRVLRGDLSIGFMAVASYSSFSVFRNNFGYSCGFTIKREVSPSLKVSMTPKASSCTISQIPILFVPGFGTSINLKFLSKSSTITQTESAWHFSKLMSESYFFFLDELTTLKIPYAVAYYDWRLSAAEAASRYLIPALEALKKQTGSPAVHIVAHSFGGLVSRSYIQGDAYAGDVISLTTLGTPHQGAAKAYPIWEAGELPKDWSAFRSVLRLYAYQHRDLHLDQQAVIHRYLPGVRDFMPRYNAIRYQGVFQDPTTFTYTNPGLQELERGEPSLYQRVSTMSVYGYGVETTEVVETGYAAGQNYVRWPDGEPIAVQPERTLYGDGTVPQVSAVLAQGYHHQELAGHAELPAAASQEVLQKLYPKVVAHDLLVRNIPYRVFNFDCPIRVRITLPDGRLLTTDDEVSEVGEVELSDEMIWMITPIIEGEYVVEITALADATVRTWVDDGEIQEVFLEKDQAVVARYDGFTLVLPRQEVTDTQPEKVVEKVVVSSSEPSPPPRDASGLDRTSSLQPILDQDVEVQVVDDGVLGDMRLVQFVFQSIPQTELPPVVVLSDIPYTSKGPGVLPSSPSPSPTSDSEETQPRQINYLGVLVALIAVALITLLRRRRE